MRSSQLQTTFFLGLLAPLQLVGSSSSSHYSLTVGEQTSTTSAESLSAAVYFGDDFPDSCITTCDAYMSDVNRCPRSGDASNDTECFCEISVKTHLLSCGNCIVAAGNVSSQAYLGVEALQVEYPLMCNTDISFTGIDSESVASISSSFWNDDNDHTSTSTTIGRSSSVQAPDVTTVVGTVNSQATGLIKSSSAPSLASQTSATSSNGGMRLSQGIYVNIIVHASFCYSIFGPFA
ncbi:hypothetical protein T439DRAFT_383703 [Meredithblackwellia eburnea MCA 4105]